MTDDLMEILLHAGESSTLDYKDGQYPWAGADEVDRSELLKDILAFANAFRDQPAYILRGVKEVSGGRALVAGVSCQLPDNEIQQFIRGHTNRPIIFSYQPYTFESKQVGVIMVPVQDPPFYSKRDYGNVKKDVVYYRLGSATAVADPDLVSKMGKPAAIAEALRQHREEERRERVERQKEQLVPTVSVEQPGHFLLSLYNPGPADVFIKEVRLCRRLDADKTDSTPLFPALVHVALDGQGTKLRQASPSRDWDVPSRKSVDYIFCQTYALLDRFTSAAEDAVWISVFTHAGELLRVEGKDFLEELRVAEEGHKEDERKKRPINVTVVFYSRDGTRGQAGTATVVLTSDGRGSFSAAMPLIEGKASEIVSNRDRELICQSLIRRENIGHVGELEWRAESPDHW